MKALINARIFDYTSYIEKGYIIFDKQIIEVGTMDSFQGVDEVIDCEGCIVMPSLINCHTHIYSAFARGMNIPFSPKSFKDILEQLWWKLDSQLDKAAIYYSAMSYGMDCISKGVTSIIDHHASVLCINGSLSALDAAIGGELGMRGIYCFETSDRFSLEDCIEENLSFSASSTEFTSGLFGMHASMSLSHESLKKISQALDHRPIHIHVAESLEDIEDCYFKYNQSIVERLDSFGLLNKNSLLAHCIHINEREAELIAKRGCFVALNPTSNMNNAVGLPDYDLLRKHGVKCVVGNDGLGADITRDYLNLLFSMKNKLGSPMRFSLEELKQVIMNGYEYVGSRLHIKLGRIERGYEADMIVLPYDPPTPVNQENMLGHVVFGVFDGFKPKQVWIAGDCVVDEYRLVKNMKKTYEEIREEAARVWKRLGI